MASTDQGQGKGDAEHESAAESYARAGPWLDASWQLTGAVALWTFVGWWLDKKLGTAPWLLVAGAVLGIGIGFYLFFRAVAAIGKKRGEGKR